MCVFEFATDSSLSFVFKRRQACVAKTGSKGIRSTADYPTLPRMTKCHGTYFYCCAVFNVISLLAVYRPRQATPAQRLVTRASARNEASNPATPPALNSAPSDDVLTFVSYAASRSAREEPKPMPLAVVSL